MILGIGTDIVRIKRFDTALEQFGARFPRRILSRQELQEFASLQVGQAAFLAKRFAAKEAVVKAMGKGIGADVGFVDIEVTHDAHGKPQINFGHHAAEYLHSMGAKECHITISDEHEYAVAFAVLE